MKRAIYLLVAGTLIMSLALMACAQSAPSPTTTETSKPTTTTTSPTVRPTPTTTSAATPQYGGVLRIIKKYSPRSLYPASTTGSSTGSQPALENLITYDSKGALVQQLATDWKYSSDSKTLTFTLRKGVKFQDGTDFNATAAKFALEARRAVKLGDLENVTSIDVVDDFTVRLNLSSFSSILLYNLTEFGAGLSSPTAVQTLGPTKISFNPVGTGPFKAVSWEQNSKMTFQRFDGYWQQGLPYLDGVQYIYISDATTGNLALQAGEADASNEQDAKDANELKQKGFNVRAFPTYTYILAPDSANADSPVANKSVREAVEYAIDGAAIAKAVGYGLWEGANQLANTTDAEYIQGFTGRPYNPEKAKQLLASAGYQNGLKLTISCRSSMNRDAVVAIGTYLKAVGIDATLDFTDTARFGTLDVGGWKNGFIIQPVSVAPMWLSGVNQYMSSTSASLKSTTKPAAEQNLLLQVLQATDPQNAKTLAQQYIKLVSDNATVIPWASYGRATIISPKVHDFTWFDEGIFRFGSPAISWLSK